MHKKLLLLKSDFGPFWSDFYSYLFSFSFVTVFRTKLAIFKSKIFKLSLTGMVVIPCNWFDNHDGTIFVSNAMFVPSGGDQPEPAVDLPLQFNFGSPYRCDR